MEAAPLEGPRDAPARAAAAAADPPAVPAAPPTGLVYGASGRLEPDLASVAAARAAVDRLDAAVRALARDRATLPAGSAAAASAGVALAFACHALLYAARKLRGLPPPPTFGADLDRVKGYLRRARALEARDGKGGKGGVFAPAPAPRLRVDAAAASRHIAHALENQIEPPRGWDAPPGGNQAAAADGAADDDDAAAAAPSAWDAFLAAEAARVASAAPAAPAAPSLLAAASFRVAKRRRR